MVSCNYCAKSAVWSATRVVTHLVNCANFKSARPDDWLEITTLVPPSTKRVNLSAAEAVESARATGARARQNAAEGIGSVATVGGGTTLTNYVDRMLDSEVKALELCIARFIYFSGLPLSVADSESFRELVTSLRPAFPLSRMPTRAQLSRSSPGSLMRGVHDDIMTAVRENLEKSVSRTLAVDGWKDVTGEPLHNIVVSNGAGQAFLVGVCHNPGERSTSNALLDHITPFVTQYEPHAVVTDNPSVMCKTRALIVKRFPKMESMGCLFHAVDLVATKAFEASFLSGAYKKANMMVKQMKQRTILKTTLGLLRSKHNKEKEGNERFVPTLKQAGDTRALSRLNTISSVALNEHLLREVFTKPEVRPRHGGSFAPESAIHRESCLMMILTEICHPSSDRSGHRVAGSLRRMCSAETRSANTSEG